MTCTNIQTGPCFRSYPRGYWQNPGIPPESLSMTRIAIGTEVVLLIGSFALKVPFTVAEDKPSDDGFTPIFDGKTLKGWKVSAKTGHSGASKNKSGGKWLVE